MTWYEMKYWVFSFMTPVFFSDIKKAALRLNHILKPNTFANFEVPAKIAHRNYFFCYFGLSKSKKINN
jgi:hypothetical protein